MPLIPQNLVIKIKSAPQTSGVYIFKDKTNNVLYIGKAINLKRRLIYYVKEEKELYEKTAQFLKLANSVEWIEVKSDIEALLLEMNLIRTLKPKYNIISKDDKRPLYIWITNDTFAKVKTARQEVPGTGDYIGPFPSGYRLTYLLKKLRHIFPFCSCTNKRRQRCMYVDLGLCPNPLNIKTAAQKAAYTRNINRLKLFLNGKIESVIKTLRKEMIHYSQNQQYEKAADLKQQINAITMLLQQPGSISQYLHDSSIDYHVTKSQWVSTQAYFELDKFYRIEGYDVANTSGQQATASMVVFEKGFSNTAQYRKFKIQNILGPNDPAMIYQTLKRRLSHPEWDYPQLIMVDGGKTQVRAALRAIKEHSLEIKVVGLAKKFEQLIIPKNKEFMVISLPLDHPALTILRYVRDEAHRFSTAYHKIIRDKNTFNN